VRPATGMMSFAIGRERSDVFRASAPMSGALYSDFDCQRAGPARRSPRHGSLVRVDCALCTGGPGVHEPRACGGFVTPSAACVRLRAPALPPARSTYTNRIVRRTNRRGAGVIAATKKARGTADAAPGLAPFVESRFLRSNERVGHGAVSAVLGSTPPKRGLYRLWFGV
jgi:hypothetical protein